MSRVAPPSAAPGGTLLLGVDFTCAPSRRKAITVARGTLDGDLLHLTGLDRLVTLDHFEALVRESGPWVGGFDFPFGLPRAFVEAQALGTGLAEVLQRLRARCADRMAFRALVDAWGNGRPAGQRLLHRRCDTAEPGAFTTSPLQTRYVPVGFMFFEGVPRLLDAGVTLPGLHAGDASRIALEAYPGLLAHEILGARSYKNRDDVERRAARVALLEALAAGSTRLGLRVQVPAASRDALVADASGDLIDALLCLVQAAWSSTRPGWGLPPDIDPVEGWVATARGAAP